MDKAMEEEDLREVRGKLFATSARTLCKIVYELDAPVVPILYSV